MKLIATLIAAGAIGAATLGGLEQTGRKVLQAGLSVIKPYASRIRNESAPEPAPELVQKTSPDRTSDFSTMGSDTPPYALHRTLDRLFPSQ